MLDDLASLLESSPWFRWSLAAAIILVAAVILIAVRAVARARLTRTAPLTATRVDDLLLEVVTRTTLPFAGAVAVLIALAAVELPRPVERIGRGLALVVCLFQIGVWGSLAVRTMLERRLAVPPGGVEDPARQTVARMLALATRAVLWIALFLVALDTFGVDITALIAGLGIGGIAVALATQNILGDLFASVSIVLDKPFVPGDFIIVGDFLGTVEQVGIKTTRVRSLGGELIVFANNDLLQSRLRNYKRMVERRIVFKLRVVYGTPADKLERIPAMLREMVEGQEGKTRFDRAHFAAFGDYALVFEIVYYVLSPDYGVYMGVQQNINLAIKRRFAAEGIELAYPTQTVLLPGASSDQPR